jgi:hypothetical protein
MGIQESKLLCQPDSKLDCETRCNEADHLNFYGNVFECAKVSATPRDSFCRITPREWPGNGQNAASDNQRQPFDVFLIVGSETPLGVVVSPDDDPRYLTLDDILTPGLIADFNAGHSEDKQVQVGDIIMSVNGTSENSLAMLEKLCSVQNCGKGAILQLRIGPNAFSREPFEITLLLREKCSLGLVAGADNRGTLVVRHLWPSGLIAEWNKSHSTKVTVQVGDLISSVNGKVNVNDMILALSTLPAKGDGDELRLHIAPREVVLASSLYQYTSTGYNPYT